MRVVVFVSDYHLFVSGVCIKHLPNLNENVSDITIITPNIERHQKFYTSLGFNNLSYLSDLDVCKRLDIPSCRLSWVDKQYAILNLDRLFDDETVFNIDADVILNRPVKVTNGEQRIFYLESEYYPWYFKTIREFFGLKKSLKGNDSFIADFMVFDKKYLEEMKASSPAFANYQTWRNVIDNNTPSEQDIIEWLTPLPIDEVYVTPAISEYETYGTWIRANYRNIVILDRSSPTYGNTADHQTIIPTEEYLAENKSIISMRFSQQDSEQYWQLIYPNLWDKFK